MTYQPFAISNFRTGFDTAVEPWLLPRDAFQVMKNAHLYRGVVEKIDGYDLYAKMTYRSQGTLPVGTINGVNKVFSGTTAAMASTNITVQATIDTAATQTEIFSLTSYDSVTNIGTLTSNLGGTGTVNFTTNAVSVTFNTAPAVLTPAGAVNRILVSYDFAPTGRPIMGIHQYYRISGGREILVFDTRRVGKVVPLIAGYATATTGPNVVSEIPHEYYQSTVATGDGVIVTFSGTLTSSNITPGSIRFTQYTSAGALVAGQTVVDNGAGGLTYEGSATVIGGIDYSTGGWSITYTPAPPAGNYVDASVGVYGTLFTGDFTNFFSFANYRSLGFFVNNIDRPMYYDGQFVRYLNTNLTAQPVTGSSGVPQYDLSTAIHLEIYRDRLVLLAPVFKGEPQLNNAYWSTPFNPLDWVTDNGFLPAPTSQAIKSYAIINTDMIVRFSNSEYVLRYTGDAFSPFRWDSTNLLWRCDAPYSAINYDSYFSSVGKPAIVSSDGVNVKRADEIIPDFTLNSRIDGQQPVISIDQTSIGQCYGTRFDDFKEGWLCYKGYDPNSTGSVQPSDSVLAFNYLDGTYAVYTFPFSCLGFGTVFNEDTWGTNNDEWDDANYTWDTFQQTKDAAVDLGGDQTGSVFQIGEFTTIGVPTTNPPNPVLMDVVTKNFNPFIEQGKSSLFGYVDFLVSANSETKLRVQFYRDDQITADFDTYFQESTLTFTPTDNTSFIDQLKVWKRIYVNATFKTLTMRIYQNIADFTDNNTNQPVRLHAMVLYCKPTGIIYS